MVDFTKATEELNKYGGKEKKKTLIYDSKKYLVKFPDPVMINGNLVFINNALSEYVGSKIFELIGFVTQKTILGTYIYNGKEKIVCACEDFTNNENILYEFKSLSLGFCLDKKIDTEISGILDVIEELDIKDTKERFWDMFVVDSLIGNTDRHNGNWGFILNNKTKEMKFAPIYDCGSCLNPMLEDKDLLELNESELKNLAINCYSCLKNMGKKINYMAYIKSGVNQDCNNAIKRVFKSIDLEKINEFIDGISCVSKIRKKFYKDIIKIRYEIIKEVYES